MKPFELRKKRLDLKLSQVKLGALLGVTGHTVLRWEQEQTPIPLMAELALETVEKLYSIKT